MLKNDIKIIRRIQILQRHIRALTANVAHPQPARLERSQKRLNALFDSLLAENMALVHYWVGHYKRLPAFHSIDTEELAQEGCVGILESIQEFRPNRGCKFSTFASWRIRQRIQRYNKRTARHQRAIVCVGDILSPVDGYQVLVNAKQPDASQESAGFTQKKGAINKALRFLDKRSRDIITALYGIERSAEKKCKIGKRLGLSPFLVRKIEREALRTIRNHIQAEAVHESHVDAG